MAKCKATQNLDRQIMSSKQFENNFWKKKVNFGCVYEMKIFLIILKFYVECIIPEPDSL